MSQSSAVLTAIASSLLIILLRFLPNEPIYADEIGYLILHGRWFFDSGKIVSLYPQCATFSSNPPASWLPLMFLTGLTHYFLITDFVSLKLVAGLGGAVTVFVFILIYRKLFLPECTWYQFITECVSPFFIGSLPLILGLFRAESAIVLFACVLTFFTLRRPAVKNQVSSQLPYVFAFLLGLFLILAVHPKSILFLPLFIAASWFTITNCWGRVALFLFSSYAIFETASFNSIRTYDPSCPQVSAVFSSFTANLVSLLSDPIEALWKFGESLSSVLLLAEQTALDFVVHQRGSGSTATVMVSYGPLRHLTVVLFFLSVFQIAISLPATLRELASRGPRFREALIQCCLLTSVSAALFVNEKRFFYEAALYLPLLFLMLGLSWRISPLRSSITLRIWSRCLVAIVAVWSFGLLILKDDLRLFGAHRQLFSNLLVYREPIFDAKDLLQQCDVSSLESSSHLVLSNSTYLALRQFKEPILLDYVATRPWSKDVVDLRAFLRQHQSAGVVAGCDELPNELRTLAVRYRDICCVSGGSL